MFMESCAQNAGFAAPTLMELIATKAERRRVPLNVHLELTYRCNEQCVHCYCVVEHGREREVRDRELTTTEVRDLLDELADLGALYLTLSGGEVFVRPDFFDIAEHARARGFAFRVFTNGIALTEAKVQRLAALEPLAVELSLFSADPAVHDAITRVPGSFRRLVRNVARLTAHGVRTYLKTVVMKPTVAGLAEVRQLGRDLGVFAHTFSCEVSPRVDGGALDQRRLQLDEEELVDYFAHALWRPAPQPIPEGTPGEIARARATCGPAVNGCCVSPYGDVFPCVAFRVPLGNVRDARFRDLWYGPPPAIRDLLAVRTYADLPECGSCDLVAFCSRCHGDNALEGARDWKSCHQRARMVASAERRVYQILRNDRAEATAPRAGAS
jgi:radical SAM protein with 4Fe4S-binding SPASM domain